MITLSLAQPWVLICWGKAPPRLLISLAKNLSGALPVTSWWRSLARSPACLNGANASRTRPPSLITTSCTSSPASPTVTTSPKRGGRYEQSKSRHKHHVLK